MSTPSKSISGSNMIISNLDLQVNWLARNDAILRIILEDYGIEVGAEETLSMALARFYDLPDLDESIPAGMDPEFYRLSRRRKQLTDDNLRRDMRAIWKAAPQLCENEEEDAYQEGFAYLAQKRKIAQKNNLAWYLRWQANLLRYLQEQAFIGKLGALSYGLAIGVGLAGYMTMTLGFALISANLWILPLVALIAWFPMQQNFWISRRAPSELLFDMKTSPREISDKENWKVEFGAIILGFCNAIVYGGLTAYGSWEFFAAAALNASPFGMLLCALGTLVLGAMVFLPELGLGIKFNREQLKVNPFKKLLASIRVDQNGHLLRPDLSLINTMTYKQLFQQAGKSYLWRFSWVLSCVVVGMVFTTLAASSMTASVLGIPFWGATMLLGMMALSLVPFYLDKALKNAMKLHESDYAAQEHLAAPVQKAQVNPEPTFWESISEKYPRFTRCVNASVNSVPAFLGGLAMVSGFGGIVVGMLTGFAGGVASFLSGEDGKQEGYEAQIGAELAATEEAYQSTLRYSDEKSSATGHLLSFRPFHVGTETRLKEISFLEGTLPLPPIREKVKAF